MNAGREPWMSVARRNLPAMRAWREAFHREPELSLNEEKTQEKVVGALRELGIPFRTFDDFHGVVGMVGAERAGPVIALRADMDALPLTELTGLPFQSRFPGKMHACGHDVHMSALLGAAAMLVRGGRSMAGPVKLIFQPAEEEGDRGGALPLIERGCLESPKVDFVVGQHVDPALPLGTVGWRIGPTMAASDYVRITVVGRGGHASTPQQGPDAIVIASEIVTGLQTLVSRVREPFDPVVVSVGSIHGGTRHNILPNEVVLEGTVRTLRASTRDVMEHALRRKARAIAAGHGRRYGSSIAGATRASSTLPVRLGWSSRGSRSSSDARMWSRSSTRSWGPRISPAISSGCPGPSYVSAWVCRSGRRACTARRSRRTTGPS